MSTYRFVILVIAISLFTVPGFAQDRGKAVVPKGEKSVQSQPYAEGTLIKAKGPVKPMSLKRAKNAMSRTRPPLCPGDTNGTRSLRWRRQC